MQDIEAESTLIASEMCFEFKNMFNVFKECVQTPIIRKAV